MLPPAKLFLACRILGASLVLALAPFASAAAGTAGANSKSARALFAQPTADYATGPLWVWNDLLTEEQIRGTLRDLAGQGVLQAFVHPRPGLMTPYLSDDWFRLWRVALDEGKRLGMKIWIYDENSYPSGFAGGIVPELMPESRGIGLSLTESNTPPRPQDTTIAIYRIAADAMENVTARAKSGEALPAGRYVHATQLAARNSPWHGNRCYVNLLTPGVTQKFLEVTLEPYRKELGQEFGRMIPGVFTDEPHVRPAGGLPWCADLPERFQAKWGYSLLDTLPSLSFDVGDWRRVRHNYLQLVNELFVERWAKPYYDWCAAHQLEATGHYWEHEWPNCRSVPDNMTMAAWQHRPGIDTLMNSYADGPSAQFGNARAAREVTSLANQLGRTRTLCEAYGAAGWDLRFEDMKRIADWLQVLGINTINEHLSYVSLRGGRKRDHPQSFSYHEPWWQAYHLSARYQSRLSAALSQGEQRNDILLLQPTTSAWMYNFGRHSTAQLETLGKTFQDVVNAFEAAQLGYDIGSEYVLAQHGKVAGSMLVVGRRSYGVVVIPPLTENVDAATFALIEQFARAGGTLLALDAAPQRLDGKIDPRAATLARAPGWKQVTLDQATALLRTRGAAQFAIERARDDRGILFHHRRQLADGEIVFLVNTSSDHTSAGTLTSAAKSIERWDLETGRTSLYHFATNARGVATDFTLPPCGSLLLFLSKQPGKPAAAPATLASTVIAPLGSPDIARVEPNVLTLDFVDVTAGGETQRNAYCYQAAQFVFRKAGLAGNPWESAVQFRDELLKREFPATSGFEATYHFTIDGPVPANLAIVIERADLYTITCNGQPVAANRGAWWLDRDFAAIDLSRVARSGENTVTIKAARLTNFHELEPAYLRGDFRLKPTVGGFVVVADQSLQLGRWNEQGHPFYGAAVRYRQTFNVDAPRGVFAVALRGWHGSVAKVVVNGKDAGHIGWAPWECDVTPHLRRGTNTIDVIVHGTLKNTLGPHHGNPPLGRAWPAAFRVAPKTGRARGEDYSTVGYGLFEPFVLKRTQ